MTSTTRWTKRAGIAAAGAAVALIPVAAHAATIVRYTYDANGSSTIAKTNSTVKLGPTKLTAYLDIDTFNFTGSLPLPKSSTSFKAAGFLPIQSEINFIPVGQVTGKVSVGETTSVNATARYIIRLTNVKVAGFPTFQGSSCQTTSPVTIPVNTPAGQNFSLDQGGNLTGKYTIGQFANCGINTPLVNALVPGPNNTVNLQVSNGVEG